MKRLLAVVLAMLIVPMVAVTAFAYEVGEVIPESDYLTFKSVEKDVVISLTYCTGSVQYNLNGDGWKPYAHGLRLRNGDTVSFKGSNVSTNSHNHFETNGAGIIIASGTLKSLALDDEGKFQGLTSGQLNSFFNNVTLVGGIDELLAELPNDSNGRKKVVVGSMATNTGATVAVAGIIAAAGIAAGVYCLKKK